MAKTDPQTRAACVSACGSIAAGVIAAIIAVVGFNATTDTTLANTDKTLLGAANQSQAAFLREQRVGAYADFADHATQMWHSVSNATGLFYPGSTPPTTDQFDSASRDFSEKGRTFSQQLYRVNILGQDQTRKCAAAIAAFLIQFDSTLYEAGKLFRGTSFEVLSKTIPLTNEHLKRFALLTNGFSVAARKDIGIEPSPGEPLGSCD